MLHKAFTPEERAAIAKVAEEYRAAFAKLTAAKQPQGARDKARNDVRLADEKLKALQKAHADKPTEENAAALKAAKESRETLETTRQAAEKAATAAQKDIDAANRDVDAVLTQKKPGLDLPVKELMEKTFTRFRDDPNFYMTNRAAIEDLLSKSAAAKKSRVCRVAPAIYYLGPDRARHVRGDADSFDSQRRRTARPATDELRKRPAAPLPGRAARAAPIPSS